MAKPNPADQDYLVNPEAAAWLANYYSQSFGGGGGYGYGFGGGVGADFWNQWTYAVNHGFTGTLDKFDKESREKHNGQTGYWVKESHYNGTIRFPNGLGGYGIIPDIEIINKFVSLDPQGEGGEERIAYEPLAHSGHVTNWTSEGLEHIASFSVKQTAQTISLFWDVKPKAFCQKRLKFSFPAPLFFALFLCGRTKRNEEKKEGVLLRHPLHFIICLSCR